MDNSHPLCLLTALWRYEQILTGGIILFVEPQCKGNSEIVFLSLQ
jgi:hypothetical protein